MSQLISGSMAAVMLMAASVHAATVDFEDQNLGNESFNNGGPTTNSNGFYSGGVHFENNYSSDFGGYWSGFSTSTTTDTTTPGIGNQYSSAAGGGAGGSRTYAVGSVFSPITVTLPVATTVQSVDLTNTTYAAKVIENGDAAFGTTPFGGTDGNKPDYFYVTIAGYDASGTTTGSVNFYLADYRDSNNANDYVVTDWRNVDLSSLGDVVKSLTFDLTTSDVGPFGPNTPSYFAMDNLTVAAVPEPASLAAVGLAALIGLRRKRR